ncbi:MAG: hypothetical protein JOZ15_13305 [Acidobacteria bacterium]|nr:hypothetical protein [Acidobacteriota bacterium]
MTRVLLLALSLLVAIAVRSMADPWSLGGECRPEDQAKYAQFEQAVRTASPGSTVYVPNPYPTTEAQVIQDFLYQYKSFHREAADPKKLPQGELPLLHGILAGTVTFSVQQAADWTPGRCGRKERSYYFYLIRVFDGASGAEISRVTLRQSGLWSSKSNHFSGAPFPPLPGAGAAMRQVAATYHLTGDSPQYVISLGSIYCPWSEPCLAFRQGNDAYVSRQSPFSKSTNGLFKIAGEEPRIVLKPGEQLDPAHQAGSSGLRAGGTEHLFYLGGTTWTIARQVRAR